MLDWFRRWGSTPNFHENTTQFNVSEENDFQVRFRFYSV